MKSFYIGFLKLVVIVCVFSISNFATAQMTSRSYQSSTNTGVAASSAVIPVVSGISSGRHFSGARPTATGASLSGIQRAFGAFSADMGRMPTAAEGLGALLTPPPGARNWRGPYISSNNFRAALTDPWGNLYRYVVQGAGRQAMHSISSNGPDGKPGTADDLSVQF